VARRPTVPSIATTLRVPVKYAKPEASGLEYTIDASNRRLTIDIPK
jgi:hypothetical protein